MTTFGAIVTEIADNVQEAESDLEDQIKLHVIRAIDYYKGRRNWFNEGVDVSVSTVADTETVTPPSDLLKLDILRITTTSKPYQLTRRNWRTLNNWRVPAAQNTGQPSDYALRDGLVYLYPIPSGAWTLEFSGLFEVATQLTTASADGDANEWLTEPQAYALIEARARETLARGPMRSPELAQIAMLDRKEAYAEYRRFTNEFVGSDVIRPHGPGVNPRARR